MIDRFAEPLGSQYFDRFRSLEGKPEIAKSPVEKQEIEKQET